MKTNDHLEPTVFVIFGGAGDLTWRKLVPALFVRLNAMNLRFKTRMPWALPFSFSRAIQQPALEIWKGQQANAAAAQQALYHRARCNGAARWGQYDAAMENSLKPMVPPTAYRSL